jgi:hypothetical protein
MKKLLLALVIIVGAVGIATSQAPQQLQNGGVITAASSDCSVLNSCVILPNLGAAVSTIIVTTSPTTVSAFAADLRFEASYDGLSWLPVYGTRLGAIHPLALRPVNGAVSTGQWQINAANFASFRVRGNQTIFGNANVLIKAIP